MIKKLNDNEYEIESDVTEGIFYRVNIKNKTCTCPSFMYLCRREGIICKHIEKILNMVDSYTGNIVKTVKQHPEGIEAVHLVEIFGNGVIDRMLFRGELIEQHGKIKVLE